MKGVLIILLLIVLVGCAVSEPVIDLNDKAEDKADVNIEKEKYTEPILDLEVNKEKPETEISIESKEAESTETGSTADYVPEKKVENLIAHWTFDGAGDQAKDSVSDNHGKIVGAVRAEGKLGEALYFDGDDYVEFSQETVDALRGLSEGTIAFWFNYESLLSEQTLMPIFYFGMDSGPDNMYIIEIGHSAGDGSTNRPNPNDKKIYSTWIKNNREPFLCFDSTNNVEEGRWHHYAVVVGPDGNTGYLDGVEIVNRDYNFGDSNDKLFFSSIPVQEKMYLGYGRSSFMISPDYIYYKGYLDDVRIYDRALSGDEIKLLTI